MKTLFLMRACGLLAVVAVLGLAKAQAQNAVPEAIGLRISGLTSSERDALARDLAVRGEVRVGFACVPAGILLLEPIGRAAFTPDRKAATLHTVRQRIPGGRISEEQLDLNRAEAQCAEARNR